RVPGHGIEGIWVILESLDLLGDERDRAPLLESLEALCELGWDREHGGLLRYCDREGPVAPQGTASGTPYEQLVSSPWSTKRWRPRRRGARRAVTAARAPRGGMDGSGSTRWPAFAAARTVRSGSRSVTGRVRPWLRSWLCA